jgi:hypothetical protein
VSRIRHAIAVLLLAQAPVVSSGPARAAEKYFLRAWDCQKPEDGKSIKLGRHLATCIVRLNTEGGGGILLLRLYGKRQGGWFEIRNATFSRRGKPAFQRFSFKTGRDAELMPGAGWVDNDRGYVEVRDMNFDGHYDFRIGARQAAAPNWGWVHFLWDPATKRFRRSRKLDEAATSMATFDDKRKEITNWTRSNSCLGQKTGSRCSCMGYRQGYRWVKGRLSLAWREQDETCGKTCSHVRQWYRNGKPGKLERTRCKN